MKTRFYWGNHCSQSPASSWYKKLQTELQDFGCNLYAQVIRDHVVQYFGKCPVNWCWVPADACLVTISYPHCTACIEGTEEAITEKINSQLLQMCILNNNEKNSQSIEFSKGRLKDKLFLEVTIYLYTKYEKCSYKYVHQNQLWNNIQMNENQLHLYPNKYKMKKRNYWSEMSFNLTRCNE